jgi:hypothetical protein
VSVIPFYCVSIIPKAGLYLSYVFEWTFYFRSLTY